MANYKQEIMKHKQEKLSTIQNSNQRKDQDGIKWVKY